MATTRKGNLPESYRRDNLVGNVIGVLLDREATDAGTGRHLSEAEIVQRFSESYADGDFDAAESRFWDDLGGPLCNRVMVELGLGWPS